MTAHTRKALLPNLRRCAVIPFSQDFAMCDEHEKPTVLEPKCPWHQFTVVFVALQCRDEALSRPQILLLHAAQSTQVAPASPLRPQGRHVASRG